MVEISVIIPAYNVEKYIGECLDSLINQSFTDIEIICVDDGSTDSTPDILNEYGDIDSRIKIITQKNRGAGASRNAALDIAEGEYVQFLDADDYLNADSLEKMHSISKQKDLDLLLFKMANFNDKTGEKDYDYSNMPFLLEIDKEVFDYHDFKDDLLEVDVSPCTKFFKKDLVEYIRFPEGLIFEDNAFYIDYILDAERIHFLDECLYNRRIRRNSVITKASDRYIDLIEIYNIIYQKFEDKGLYLEFREKLFMRKIDSLYYRFTLINPEYKQDYFDAMKASFLEQEEEYENELNPSEIDGYCKNIFEAVLSSQNPEEFEICLKINQLKAKLDGLKKENKKLKKENIKLKKINEELVSSRSWKLTEPLRKMKRN